MTLLTLGLPTAEFDSVGAELFSPRESTAERRGDPEAVMNDLLIAEPQEKWGER